MRGPRDLPDPGLERDLRRWLREEAPEGAPHALFERVVTTSTAGTQHRHRWSSLGLRVRPGPMRAISAGLGFVILPALLVGTLLSVGPAGPVAAPTPTPFSCPGRLPSGAPGAPPEAYRVVGSLPQGRMGHTATDLGDCRVLIVGGGEQGTEAMASVELWDPGRGSVTELGPMGTARVVHAATRLRDGRVLVLGGFERGPGGVVRGPAMTAEVWDPTTLAFTSAGAVDGPFAMPTATLLDDGRVLVVGGGSDRTTAVLWDPVTTSFGATGALREGRAGGHTASLLPDGTVLVVGGSKVSVDAQGEAMVTAVRSVEVWDPETGQWHDAPPLPAGRYDHTTTLLPSGRILVVGGMVELPDDPTRQEISPTTLLRDRASGVFHASGSLVAPRSGHDADLLQDGRVLVVGGDDLPAAGTAEAWDPDTGTVAPLAPPSVRLAGVATRLPDGTLLLSGGMAAPLSPDSEAPYPMALDLEVYDPTQ